MNEHSPIFRPADPEQTIREVAPELAFTLARETDSIREIILSAEDFRQYIHMATFLAESAGLQGLTMGMAPKIVQTRLPRNAGVPPFVSGFDP
jgi:hypothetical protein